MVRRQHRPRPPRRLPRAPHLGGGARTSRSRRCASTCAGSRPGESIDRPTAEVLRERDRITGEYRELLAEDDRSTFDETLELARLVFVYIEEHVLYIEHWMWATFWGKSKELGRALAEMGEFDDPEDMFFLRRYEVAEAIYDCVVGWSVGSRSRGADYWRPIVTRRREIYDALQAWEPPPALGPPPAEVNEPFTVMLWGITTVHRRRVAQRRRRRRRAGAARHRRLAGRRRGAGADREARVGARSTCSRATSSSAPRPRRRGRRSSPGSRRPCRTSAAS